MSQYRFFVSPEQISGRRVTLTASQARQIFSVLRMRQAQHIVVLDNQGWQYGVRLDKVSSDLVAGEIVSREKATGEPKTKLTLYQALLKKDNFEWILQKGTEIGIAKFVPLISQRCVVRHKALKPAKKQRWQRIISEAAEQSGRGRLPILTEPITLAQALGNVNEFDRALVPWEREPENAFLDSLSDVIQGGSSRPAQIAVFIGPEGGFAEEEIEDAVKAGVQPVTLGSRILRSETAAMIASTLALSAFGDLD